MAHEKAVLIKAAEIHVLFDNGNMIPGVIPSAHEKTVLIKAQIHVLFDNDMKEVTESQPCGFRQQNITSER